MRRLLLLLGVGALALLGLAGPAVWHWLPKPGVTERNYERVAIGMALANVEAILGGPSAGFVLATRDEVDGNSLQEVGLFQRWQQDGLVIMVAFDEDKRVSDKCLLRWHDPSRKGLWEQFDRLLLFSRRASITR